MSRTATAAAGLLALLLAGARPAAGNWVGEALCATGLPRDGEFGSAVAVGDDGTIAVGDYRHDAVYLFRRDGNGRCLQLDPVRGRAGEWFGFDLAIDNGQVLIGAPRSGGTGAAYLYDLKAQRLEPLAVPQAQRGDEVGSAVAIDGGLLAIGARGADDRRGRVYAGPAGNLTAVPTPSGLAPAAELGQSVALSGNTLVMGAPAPYRGSGSPGAAWAVDLDNGALSPLTPCGGLEPEAAFGYAVAVDGDRILVGAPLAGAVFEFRPDGSRCRKLDLPGNRGDQLGVAVALDGTTAVVGARYASGNRGEVYVVDLGNGSSQPLAGRLIPAVPAGAQLGFSVAVRGDVVAAGAFRQNGTGAAYRFDPAVTVEFADSSSSVLEADGKAPLRVIVRGPADRLGAPVTVNLTTSDGTANRDADYSLAEDSFTIPADTRTNEAFTLTEVQIVRDALQEEPETFTVRLSAEPPVLVGDQKTHEVTIYDSPLVVSAGPLQTSEAGGSARLEVRLAARPASRVVVSLSTSDPTEGIVSPARLTFTPDNWDRAQTVQVVGRDDALCDGDQAYEILAETASRDRRFARLSRSTLATNSDDEVACLTAVKEVCTDGGGTVVYTISLANQVSDAPDVSAELVDILPPQISVVTASADPGTATADPVANSVRWTGLVPAAGDAATITIVAALDALPDPEVTNRAEVTYVRDDRGTLQTVETNEVDLAAADICPAP